MTRLFLRASALALIACGPVVAAQEDLRIRAHQAIDHVGEYAQVCGVIADTNYARRSRGSPSRHICTR